MAMLLHFQICLVWPSTVRSTLQKQQSLPVRPIIPLVARISDQNASGAPPMTVREKSRLDKFKQLLASPNTDLGRRATHFDSVDTWLLLVTACWICCLSLYLFVLLGAVTEELRKHSWSGMPREVRPITWRLLSVSLMTVSFAISHVLLCILAFCTVFGLKACNRVQATFF